MDDKILPAIIVTCRDLALMNAIENEFPVENGVLKV